MGSSPGSCPATSSGSAITWGKPIIMGRKTHDSLGKALPGRTNIILTRQSDFHATDCRIAHDPNEALAIARAENAEEAFVIGGSQIFAAFLSECAKVYLTIVEGSFEGDTYFPSAFWESPDWEMVEREPLPADERNQFCSRFEVYQRRF